MPKIARPRILFAPKDTPLVSSGYGIIGKHLLPRLADRYGKKNILILAPVYQQQAIGEWQGMTMLPGTGPNWGEDLMGEYFDRYDVTFILQVGDWGHLAKLPELASQGKVQWVAWLPYDYIRIPNAVVDSTIHYAWKVVPWTEYARKKFLEHKLGNVTDPIPLGVDERVWRQLSGEGFPNLMKATGFEKDALNILFIAANQRRKYLQEQLQGIAIFRKAFPNRKVRIYMHTAEHGEADLAQVIHGMELQDITRCQDTYSYLTGGWPEEQLCALVNCASVVLCSALEGFGFAHVQAQACGVPVITLNEGPGDELVAYGALAPVIAHDLSQPAAKPIPHPAGVAEALAQVDSWPETVRAGGAARARQRVLESYTWNHVANKWFHLIEGTLMPEREKYSMYVPEVPSAMLRRRARKIIEVG